MGMDEYKVDSEYKVYELGPEADDFINDKGNRVERRGDFEKEYYYPILCAKRSMISSLVEWIENMDEWELKINILRFIGTVAYLLALFEEFSLSDLKIQAPENNNILRLFS